MYGYGYFSTFRSLSGGGVPVDPDAQSFITAASITDPTQQSAVNQLVIDLKGYSLWTKMKAVYPFVGGSAASHKWNLKDPRDLDAAFRLSFAGGWTHSANGALPNGTNGYADTFVKPATNLALNSTHLCYYSRTDISANQVEMGLAAGNDSCYLLYSYSGTGFKAINETQHTGGSVFSPTNGLLIGSRTASNVVKYYHKGSLIDSLTTASGNVNNNKIFLACYNSTGLPGAALFSSKECAFASIGDGLNDTESANLYTAVQAFQTTLSRNV